ncbi:hypothetical protein BC643_2870 [Mangrovibacterium diazotrophicum]|uniref:Uncharacterized protein n=1 Tax=Mangrovibacterium diazotrophicum TaxID=1261403 RepID=A0A419WAL7_9BACT|nr:hypothetical protein BC643_2870 [Mangrovibacterium diazotrophicum]
MRVLSAESSMQNFIFGTNTTSGHGTRKIKRLKKYFSSTQTVNNFEGA